MFLLVAVRDIVDLAPGCDGERPDKIPRAGRARCDEVGEREVRLAGGFFLLLAEAVENVQRFAGVTENLDVFTNAGGAPESHDSTRAEEFLGDDLVEEAARVVVKFPRLDSDLGIIEQSRRHSCIASLLRIPHLVVAINKMDLVGYSEERFMEIRDQFEEFLPRLDMKDVKFIPLSALAGDNVVEPSSKTPWFTGPTLLGHLESVHIGSDWNLNGFRLPVQWVNRPNNPTDPRLHDFRGFSGQIAGGIVKAGQKIMVLPSGLISRVKEIWTYDAPLAEAGHGAHRDLDAAIHDDAARVEQRLRLLAHKHCGGGRAA